MRLSEKTIELNICSQLNTYTTQQMFWFGLTQRQEASLGFDVCCQSGGRMMFFQVKASNKTVRGARRFYTTHRQLQNLINISQHRSGRFVYYALPMIGTTHELVRNRHDIISNTWLLEVSNLPNPFPMTRRISSIHYIDATPPTAVIWSNPIKANLVNFKSILQPTAAESYGAVLTEADKQWFEQVCTTFKRNALGLVLIP